MARSYLGIITPRGLERLVPETEHAAPFLLRRAHRDVTQQTCCCWAVLSEITASDVRRDVSRGKFWSALARLNIEAEHLGTLLPPASDEELADQQRSC
ncbi:MAG: hypothetical protein MPJ50_11970 [Pirellulales bacterium]|nr:hypothetical protein [Pirellulales bacterium]